MNTITLAESTLHALKKAIADSIYAEMKDEKAAFTEALLDEYREQGNKAKVAKVGRATVATHTVTEPKPKTRTVDEQAFWQWLAQQHPEVFYEHTEILIDQGKLNAVMARLDLVDSAFVDPETGEQVPGIEHTADEPKSFSTTYKPGGKDALIEAFLAGELDDLIAKSPILRQLGGQV